MRLRRISEIKNLKGKRVLVRVDFNVPVEKGKVKDDYKIVKTLPTIKYLLSRGAKVVLVSHLGRPKGVDKKLSLAPVAKHLEKILGERVKLISDFRFQISKSDAVVLLENIRFFPEEEKCDIIFTKQLAGLADIFVSECFAVAHRKSASITGVAKYLPAYAGLLMTEEVAGLERATTKAKRPLVLIIGGAKTETKIPILKNFLNKADFILVSGGIFNTMLAARGQNMGVSLVDKEYLKLIKNLVGHKRIIKPVDMVAGKADGKNARIVAVARPLKLSKDEGIFDIGPATVKLFAGYIKKARTLIWNGAMGRFEQRPYQYGTYSLARLFAARAQGKAFAVAGGGETVEILEKLKLTDDVDLVSTGGGAMLEYLSGKVLPGVKAISERVREQKNKNN